MNNDQNAIYEVVEATDDAYYTLAVFPTLQIAINQVLEIESHYPHRPISWVAQETPDQGVERIEIRRRQYGWGEWKTVAYMHRYEGYDEKQDEYFWYRGESVGFDEHNRIINL